MSEKREMTAVEFLKEWKRMCDFYKRRYDGLCGGCPLAESKGVWHCGYCILHRAPKEEAIPIVQKWAEEHPVKTRMSDFLEKFPNAPMERNNIRPLLCVKSVGYTDKCTASDCTKCWKTPLEVEP